MSWLFLLCDYPTSAISDMILLIRMHVSLQIQMLSSLVLGQSTERFVWVSPTYSSCQYMGMKKETQFLFVSQTLNLLLMCILGEGGYVVCYEMADIERKLGFGRNSLVFFPTLLIMVCISYNMIHFVQGPFSLMRKLVLAKMLSWR